MDNAQHYGTFSFYPIDRKLVSAVFDSAKRIEDFRLYYFPSTALYVDASGNRTNTPAKGSVEKQNGVFVLGVDTDRPTGARFPLDVELARYLKTLCCIFSPKLRRHRNNIVSFLENIRRLDEALEKCAKASAEVQPINPNTPCFNDLDMLSHVRCQANFVDCRLPAFHTDRLPGTKAVFSNIPTIFRENPVIDDDIPTRRIVADKQAAQIAPKPYDAAVFDMVKTVHSAPEIQARYREFLSFSR